MFQQVILSIINNQFCFNFQVSIHCNKKYIKPVERRNKTIIFVIRDYNKREFTEENVKERVLRNFNNSEQEESINYLI